MLKNDLLNDPVKFIAMAWPHITLYDKQKELLESVRENRKTVVPAGNDLGKDFTAALATLWFFLSRQPCKVITTSAGQTQLKSVLWGEMARFIATSRIPLPLRINNLWLQYEQGNGEIVANSYVRGMVTNKDENLQGHHLAWGERNGKPLPRTLAILDEASGIEDEFYNAIDTWAHRILIVGNPLPCENFFKAAIKGRGDVPGGDIKNPDDPNSLLRRIIHIKATDSPNVQLGLAQEAKGEKPDFKEVIPGVLNYREYKKRRLMWDKIRQCIGLDGLFYEGAEVLLYPPQWLDRAEEIDKSGWVRTGKRTLGVDAAAGGDNTVWCVINKFGVLYVLNMKTGDTDDIPGRTIAIAKDWGVRMSDVLFDAGGGGKQHADRLRKQGHKVRIIPFGGSPTADPDQRMWQKTRVVRKEETDRTGRKICHAERRYRH
ncbi:MAG: hypothetical protein IIC56_01870 [Proteobacteria bacterium]|nr:hypothetical protein [Pseudomonadota bacterium]